ncbi:sensor histidine kinase [Microbacterium sp. No. 7]|uniref:sensor histidine kinase n=1 Tax=Microbacterium sp. No. 7 TaxID=1714373 RepID=UPI0006D03413|nr:HAMP domain-containing sensor histidine kinase [Microbacterium sp. No. 7]ALJ19817.1 histidine kinase [Microbacterium sp. No. 7]
MTRRRAPWRLQTRLIVLVVGVVSLILVVVALATGAALRTIMAENLDAQITQAAARMPPIGPTMTADEVLSSGHHDEGTLVVMKSLVGPSGAYVADGGALVSLTDDELSGIVAEIEPSGWGPLTIDGIGDYRVRVHNTVSGFVAVGLPTSELNTLLGRIAASVGLMTLAGLLVLAAAISLVIRRSLAPLRAAADTATRVAGLPMAEGAVSIPERVPASEADERTEIGRVGAALNTLLDHVDQSLAARQRNEERMRAFVADASHELRTPLASIRGYSELSLRALAHGTDAGQTTTEALERIQAQSVRMTALVEDLLLLARLDEGAELVVGTVDLTRLAIEAVADARAAGPDHEWVLEVGDRPVVTAGDEARLHQVAVNLLANARVHTPAGTTVTTSVSVDDGWAVLRVHDDGPGIDEAVAGELFERFSRADRSRARRSGGTGLGLSIARAIVAAHHGTIRVDSAPGATTFEVRLPVRPDDPSPVAAP